MCVYVTQEYTRIHTLVSLFRRQMSRLMHAWKSRDTGPYPDSAASLSNMQLTVRRRNTGSQASDTHFVTADDRRREFKRRAGAEKFYRQLGLLWVSWVSPDKYWNSKCSCATAACSHVLFESRSTDHSTTRRYWIWPTDSAVNSVKNPLNQ